MTSESLSALANLRIGNNFDWSTVNVLSFLLYCYAVTIKNKEWDKAVLGMAFWFVEFIWEMFNGLVLHFSNYSALWTLAGKSSFLIYVGLNIEIAFMFAVAPLILFYILPEDKNLRIVGIPNRILIPLALGLFCVLVETILNRIGVLVWAWSFWSFPNLELVACAYCLPFLVFTWLYDHTSLPVKLKIMYSTGLLAILCHIIFAVWLQWI